MRIIFHIFTLCIHYSLMRLPHQFFYLSRIYFEGYQTFISNMKTQFRKNISYTYCHLFASYRCGPVCMGCGLNVGYECKINQTISLRPVRKRSIWTVCVRSEFSRTKGSIGPLTHGFHMGFIWYSYGFHMVQVRLL